MSKMTKLVWFAQAPSRTTILCPSCVDVTTSGIDDSVIIKLTVNMYSGKQSTNEAAMVYVHWELRMLAFS